MSLSLSVGTRCTTARSPILATPRIKGKDVSERALEGARLATKKHSATEIPVLADLHLTLELLVGEFITPAWP